MMILKIYSNNRFLDLGQKTQDGIGSEYTK